MSESARSQTGRGDAEATTRAVLRGIAETPDPRREPHTRPTAHGFAAGRPHRDEDAVSGVESGPPSGFPDTSFGLVLHPTPSVP